MYCHPGVAPRVGAWIETMIVTGISPELSSHPVWVRGLKPAYISEPIDDDASHPVWVRGLKLKRCLKADHFRSRTPCGCVD